ncbi:fimbria/pilus outer membrane usher protein [Pseudomonas gingeri]|uniref:fimbria/pilus outer membrane usher protein n=1 Tax=Pseudomonas gingeri TaxID=117681 RepID=UPI0015A368CA|nr:fimbria/pilus outer membrane usher protein [Pseudomonas gingeri]NWA27227.1 fimbria/pilus outer membrane usher protein [Pseudomonas gingeri]
MRNPRPPARFASASGLAKALGVAVLLGFGEPLAAEKKDEGAETEFDLSVLSGRGLDPQVADYFRSAPRFREGPQRVTLELNGNLLGLAMLRFDQDGELCFTSGLLDKAGLQRPDAGAEADEESCHDFLREYPQTQVSLRPNSEEVSLLVPTRALRGAALDSGVYARGGTAGLLNYDVLGFDTRSRLGGGRFFSATTEAGFNAGDWIVRSRQLHVSNDGQEQTEHLYAYAQRDFRPWQTTFQAGQINSAGPVFAGVQLSGVQLMPDGAQRGQVGHGVLVEGVAFDASRVEVRQSGALIYTSLVPQGPFSLGGLPLLNGTSDLEVRVISQSGSERRFVVPAASFPGTASVQPGYFLALGRVRSSAERREEPPLLATGSGTWGLGQAASFSAGLLGSDDYRASAWALDGRLWQQVGVGLRNSLSHDTRHSLTGSQNSLSLNSPLAAGVDLDLSATLRTDGYRDLLQVGEVGLRDDSASRFKHQYTAGLGWADRQLGGFSLGYSRSLMFDGRLSRRLHGSWNQSYRYASLSLSVESDIGSSGDRDAIDSGLGIRLGVSVPLGGDRRISSYLNRRGERLDIGGDYRERVSEVVSYNLGLEQDLKGDRQIARGQLDLMPRYTQLGLGVTRNDASSSYSGQLSGGLALHEGGLTFSPYAIQETFGVVSVGDLSGARIATPQGPVWTDFSGQAVVAGLPAYRNSQLEVDTRSLPRRVDLRNGTKSLEAGRGSFNRVDFSVVKVRRLLLKVTDENATPLPQGASVFSDDEDFLTTVVGDGMVFLSNVETGQRFTIRLADHSACTLPVELSETLDSDRLYETATAVCRAS